MRYKTLFQGLGLAAVLALGGCKSLDITNPNDPDGPRALADPDAIEAVAGGSVRVWLNTYQNNDAGTPLVTQAQTYSASWNNFNMNFYSSIDADGTRNSRPWQNSPAAAERTSIEAYWSGYYRSLGLANNVLKAIRINGLIINTLADTRRAETIALLMQGASLSGIAINYDKGYVLDENSDLSALTYSDRKQVRDAAIASFTNAAAMAMANPFTTPTGWTNGVSYTNVQIAQIARTMAAWLLANWPRSAAESAAVDWAQVVTFASGGMSSTTPFNFTMIGDGCNPAVDAWVPEILCWFNAVDTGRISTRVAAMLDPVTQRHPYPAAPGSNAQPNSADRRLGDGSFGTAAMVAGFGNVPLTPNGGSDFMWSSQAIFNDARGRYHQSNIGHIRYDLTREQDGSGIWGGKGPAPVFSAGQNDLLWAEGLIRSGGSLALAATKINNTRVTRGGLSPAAAGDGVPLLTSRLHYEMEIELLGLGAASYYLRRRVDGLIPGTPREMPVPAKELGVFAQPLYTWGGTGPANSPTPP